MTNTEILRWIKKELGPIIQKAIVDSKTDFTESLLGSIPLRETGNIINEHAGKIPMLAISGITRGDYTKRPKDAEKIYHGYSFWQIDIDSFPAFIKSGAWKDPYKACMMAISVLEGKRKYIKSKYPGLKPEQLLRATIAAYNYGEGNAVKRLKSGADIDQGTAHDNYSKTVLAYRAAYETLA